VLNDPLQLPRELQAGHLLSCFVVNNLEVPVHKAAELLSLAVNR
jgi:hypothetical protein